MVYFSIVSLGSDLKEESVQNSPESESVVLQLNHFNNRVIKEGLHPLSGPAAAADNIPFRSAGGQKAD